MDGKIIIIIDLASCCGNCIVLVAQAASGINSETAIRCIKGAVDVCTPELTAISAPAAFKVYPWKFDRSKRDDPKRNRFVQDSRGGVYAIAPPNQVNAGNANLYYCVNLEIFQRPRRRKRKLFDGWKFTLAIIETLPRKLSRGRSQTRLFALREIRLLRFF